MPGRQHNIKVRAERGGDEAARARTDALKQAWPRDVVNHCDKLLARPMPPSTLEALLGVIGWRADRPIPEYARASVAKRGPGRPRLPEGTPRRQARRSYGRAVSRALRRLKTSHPEEFNRFYQEELNKERT